MDHAENSGPEDLLYWPLELLSNHVQEMQEEIADVRIPVFSARFKALAACGKDAQCRAIYELYRETADAYNQLVFFESTEFFPFIRELSESHRLNRPVFIPAFCSVNDAVASLEHNFTAIINSLKIVARMSEACEHMRSEDTNLVSDLLQTIVALEKIAQLKFVTLMPRAAETENKIPRHAKVLAETVPCT